MALFRDWRSPGEKWIRTDFGWRRLAEIRNTLNHQLRRQFSLSGSSSASSKASSAGSSKKVSRATSPLDVNEPPKLTSNKSCCACKENEKIEKQVKYLNELLDQRCISARSTSRESSNYTTAADAVSKLNFEQALNNDGCFPFVCQVIALMFETGQGRLSGSTQSTLLRLTDRAKDFCTASKKHSGLVLKLMESAIPFFEKLRQQQFTSFGVRNVDAKIKSVLKMKHQLRSSLHEDQSQNRYQSLELTDLPVECLEHIARYLTSPRDLLNFGMTSIKMRHVTEGNSVWRGLTMYHYGRVKPNTACWKETFIMQYREREGQLKRELSAAVCLCKTCNFVFWREYGHPCLSFNSEHGATNADEPVHQYLTPEQFLQLFAF